MKLSRVSFILLGIWFLAACAQEPVEVTRVVEIEREVEVTRQVEIEITREVEVIQEVEVTRELEVTREVEVEVTRVVEVEVTAVPTETPTPAPTNTPAPSSSGNTNPQPTSTPAVDAQQLLLAAMISARNDMLRYGGLIDGALRGGGIDCRDVVDTHDRVAFAPTFDITGESDLVTYAYGVYRAAIDIFTAGARDMTDNCRNFLANPQPGTIGSQQWGLARQQVNTAVDTIQPAIQSLGGE